MPGKPTRRVVLITGASSGIGAAAALACSRASFAVSLVARRADRLAALAARITANGGTALVAPADVTDAAAVQRAVEATVAHFGHLDVAVCNAGLGYYGRLEETPPDVLAKLMAVNLMGSFHAAQSAVRLFRQQRRGHLIFVSSIVGRRAVPGSGAYASSKFAQTGLAEGLRTELHGTGIRVSTLYPVSTDTEFREASAREFGFAAGGLGPRQTPEDVAQQIVNLIQRPRAECYPLWYSKLLAVAAVTAPVWCDRLVQRFERRRTPPLPERGS